MNEAERPAFEAHVTSIERQMTINRYPGKFGRYVSDITAISWGIWQARAALERSEHPVGSALTAWQISERMPNHHRQRTSLENINDVLDALAATPSRAPADELRDCSSPGCGCDTSAGEPCRADTHNDLVLSEAYAEGRKDESEAWMAATGWTAARAPASVQDTIAGFPVVIDPTMLPGEMRLVTPTASVQAGTGEPSMDYHRGWHDGHSTALKAVEVLATPKAAPAAVSEPSDGDYARWAMREGAVQPSDGKYCIAFASHAQWGRFCDRARAALSSPPSVGEPPSNCTCHPDDRPQECQKKFAASECIATDSAKPAGEQFTEAEKDAEPRIYGHPEDYERREDGKVVRKDRWEWAVRNIVTALHGARYSFEIDDIVNEVRALATAPDSQGAPKPVAWDLDRLYKDAREVFDADGLECPQVVRDVIEWYAASLRVLASDCAQAAGQDARDAARYRYLRTRDVTLEAEDGPQYVSYTPSLGDDGSKLDFLVDEAMAAGQEDAS